MNRYYYDLHVHSCLSPCGDDDSTPNNIAGMASLCGLNIVALTDHNSAKNCPAFFEASKRYGIVPVAGMELTTAEDIHVVCLFEFLEDALAFDEEIDGRRIKIKNREDIFGKQLIMNGMDEITGTEEFLLPNATTVSLDEVPALTEKFNGVCFPAHIDRQANGIVEILGTFPQKPEFNLFELNDRNKADEYIKKYSLEEKLMVVSSDAHYLTSLRDENEFFELDDEPYSSAIIRKKLFEKLRGKV